MVERIDAVTRRGRRRARARAATRPSGSARPGSAPTRACSARRSTASLRRWRRRRERARSASPSPGAAGRMGQAVCAAVEGADGHGAHGPRRPGARHERSPTCSATPTSSSTSRSPDTRAGERARVRARPACTSSSGRPASTSTPLRGPERGANVFVAPNFAIGAVLMMRFAAEAVRAHGQGRDHRAAPRPQARRAERAPPRARRS